MLDFSNASLIKLALHKVGNKQAEEGIIASSDLFPLKNDEDLRGMLSQHFLEAFKLEEYHCFTHHTDVELNEVYTFVRQIFDSPGSFLPQSVNLLKHLYDKSEHHQIKSGELSVVYFEECVVGDEMTEAIGIFKTDNKDTFLKYSEKGGGIMLHAEEGVKLKKIDKGALIFNTDEEEGFKVLIVDSAYAETQFWRDNFLLLERMRDESFHTHQVLGMCKDFVEDFFEEDDGKSEKVMFLNKSLDYFMSHDKFDLEEFTGEVADKPAQQEKFRNFQQKFATDQEEELSGNFKISAPAVKKMKRKFRNYIKLDTKIEIRLHIENPKAQEEFVERGFDEEKGMYYYKVFFNKES